MRIVAFEAENFKRLRAVSIKPDGSPVVHINGQNGAGKTSVLDAIAAALGGADLCPTVPIRKGENHAEVTINLGQYVVTRRWTEKTSTLVVAAPDGAEYRSPQSILDKLIGDFSFDPLAFNREDAKDQVETLRRLAKLDFTIHDVARLRIYTERTALNREIGQLKGALALKPEIDAPDEEVKISDLLAEQQRRIDVRDANKVWRDAVQAARREQLGIADIERQIGERIARLEKELLDARVKLKIAQEDATAICQKVQEAEVKVASLVEPDLDGIRKQLAEAEGTNAKVRAKKARGAEAVKLAEKIADEKKLTGQIDLLDAKKAKAIAEAQFPVEGLGFNDQGVTLNELPFGQASAAEQLRVSVSIGAALNPKLRVVLVRDGSLLDEDSMRLLAGIAEELDLQIWLERVGEGGEAGVLIEDGAVAAPTRTGPILVRGQAE